MIAQPTPGYECAEAFAGCVERSAIEAARAAVPAPDRFDVNGDIRQFGHGQRSFNSARVFFL